MSPILPVRQIAVPALPQSGPAGSQGEAGAFQKVLESSIGAVEQTNHNAEQAVNSFLKGDSEDLHTAAIATQRAEISMELFLQVRSKVVNAYQEIMRMQL